jgi:hypothetical protein
MMKNNKDNDQNNNNKKTTTRTILQSYDAENRPSPSLALSDLSVIVDEFWQWMLDQVPDDHVITYCQDHGKQTW